MDDLLSLRDFGLFLRREALQHGYDDRELVSALRAGQIRRIRQGAYVESLRWQDASTTERFATLGRAVLLSHKPGSIALSHTSAVVAHGLAMFQPDFAAVHVTRMDGGPARRGAGVIYHAGDVPASHVEEGEEGLRLTAARAAIEFAAIHDVPRGLVVLDSALDSGLATARDLHDVRDVVRGWPHTARLEITLRLAAPGSESVAESLVKHLCWQEHLPRPIQQYPVQDLEGRVVATVDFAWPEQRTFGEFDGKVKYGRLLKPGQSPNDVVFAEKRREDRIRELTGWLMIRLVWQDLARPGLTAGRIRAQFARAAGPV